MFKQGNTYYTKLREAYQDLLTNYGVGAKNREGLVKTVFDKLNKHKSPRLAKKEHGKKFVKKNPKPNINSQRNLVWQ